MSVCNIRTRAELSILQKSVGDTTARSLDLLRAIDQTIDAMDWIAARAKADSEWAIKEIARLNSCERVEQIDQDSGICDKLEEAQDAIHALHTKLAEKRLHAHDDAELRDDDGVVDAYDNAIVYVMEIHNAINDLRWAIKEHDADLSPRSEKEYTDIDEMFAALDS